MKRLLLVILCAIVAVNAINLSGAVAYNITLQSPANASTYTLTDNVTFVFNASINNLANCSLIINSDVNRTNVSTITKDQNHSLYFSLLNNVSVYYNWSVNCTDTSNNQESSATRQLYVDGRNLTMCNYVITGNTTYYLDQNVSLPYEEGTPRAIPPCVEITSGDINFDCRGYAIVHGGVQTGSGFTSKGIVANNSNLTAISGNDNDYRSNKTTNLTIQNCAVINFTSGIIIDRTQNSTIRNNTIFTTLGGRDAIVGLELDGVSSSNLVINNTISRFLYGIVMQAAATSCDNTTAFNVIKGNNISNNTIAISGSHSHTRFIGNIFYSNGQIISSRGGYMCNYTIINFTSTGNADYDLNASTTTMSLKNAVFNRYDFINVNLSIDNTSNIRIDFGNITQNGTDFMSDVILNYNNTYVNSSRTGLNKTATIVFYNLRLNNPRIDRNGAGCPSSICSIIAWNSSNGTLIFNVTSFSNYSAIDYCGNGYCEGTENCNGCPTDCGSCASTPPGGGSGAGGGSITAITYLIGSISDGKEISREFKKGDKIKFIINNEDHNLTVKRVTNENATIEINSTPVLLTLSVGESRKVNLTSADYYDLIVTLNSITSLKANITIKQVTELIKAEQPAKKPQENITQPTTQPLTQPPAQPEVQEKERSIWWLWVILIGVVSLALIGLWNAKRRKK